MTQQEESLLKIQKPLVVEKTGDDDRPEWISESPFFEDNNRLHFIGCMMGGVDYALTLRLAKSEATKNLLESIQIKAQAEFSHAIQGQNKSDIDLGRYVTDAVAWTIDNLRISGIRENKAYYEKLFDPISQTIKFNAWVQLEIPKTDYLQAKTESTRKLLDRAIQDKNQEAKKKALELLEKLQQEA